MPEQTKKSLVISIYFALAVGTLLVFWQVRNFGFVDYDDGDYVSANPHVLNGLTADGVLWAFTANRSSNWHPLTWLSLMLDCQLFGANAGWMHLVNVLLHLANTLLLFAVFKKMTGALWQSAFVAALFALHPMHVESVAWVAERKDVLSTLFWLLAMLAYVQYCRCVAVPPGTGPGNDGIYSLYTPGTGPGNDGIYSLYTPGTGPGAKHYYLLAVAFFALGLMAKPMLVTLPFVFLLLDYWPLERIAPVALACDSEPPAQVRGLNINLLIEKIPFFVLSVISSVITFLVQRSGGAVIDIDNLSLNDRIANAFLSYAQYISKMFWPANLAVFYPFGAAGSIPLGQGAICAFLLLVISIFIIYFGRRHKYLPLGWFWFIGTLVPVIGLVQAGQQAYADRYTYIPYIGLFIIPAWGLPQLISNLPQRKIILGSSMAIVLTVLGICAHRQMSYWKNSVTLFSHALAVTQNNWRAHNILGASYDGLGRDAEAIEAYEQAIKIKPDYAEAYYNLGHIYGKLGRDTEAIEAYEQAVKIKPDYANAYYNLGLAYDSLGRDSEAIEAYSQAIKTKPADAEAYNNLGSSYGKLGRHIEAIDTFKQAIRIKPDYSGAHCNLGLAYLAIGDKNSALAEYNILKFLNPELANKLLNQINK